MTIGYRHASARGHHPRIVWLARAADTAAWRTEPRCSMSTNLSEENL